MVQTACEDIPKSFVVCDHPYHRQIIYISQLNSQTLLEAHSGERRITYGRYGKDRRRQRI